MTETDLRKHWYLTKETEVMLDKDACITPAARDFIKEKGITLHFAEQKGDFGCMPTSPKKESQDGYRYVNAETKEGINVKPENMTHLYGNVLVPKNHPRIVFRGKLDSLQAQIIIVQMIADEEGYPQIAEDLGELLDFVRSMLGAEVREKPLEEIRLLNLESAEIRRISHNVKKEIGISHPVPDYKMGWLCIALNNLRTQVREAEIAAINAFCEGNNCSRPDIIEGLNRLSSCVYIILCRKLGLWYGRK